MPFTTVGGMQFCGEKTLKVLVIGNRLKYPTRRAPPRQFREFS